MSVNFELYKVFYYVASTLSFSEASRQLFISQSAVSQAIKQLEQKLECQLFFRTTKKISLTPEGEKLFRYIEPAINLINVGEAQMITEDPLVGGQLRIGASDTICRYFLIPYIEKFHQKFTNVQISITNQTSKNCIGLLDNGQVDIVIVNYPNAQINSKYELTELKSFKDVFLCGEKYRYLSEREVSIKELASLPLLVLDGNSSTSDFLKQLFRKHRIQLVPEFELTSNDLLMDLTKIGLGITFVPDYCLPEENTGLYNIRVSEQYDERKLVAVLNENLPVAATTREFIQLFL